MKREFLIIVLVAIAVSSLFQSCATGKNKIPGVYVFEYKVDSNMIKCYKGIPMEEKKIPNLNPEIKSNKKKKEFTCYEDAILIYFNYQQLILKKDSTCIFKIRSDFDKVELTDTGTWYVSNDTLYTHYEGALFLSRWKWKENALYQYSRTYGTYARRDNVFLGYSEGNIPLKKKLFRSK